MRRNQTLSMDTLEKITTTLNCDVDGIVQFTADNTEGE